MPGMNIYKIEQDESKEQSIVFGAVIIIIMLLKTTKSLARKH